MEVKMNEVRKIKDPGGWVGGAQYIFEDATDGCRNLYLLPCAVQTAKELGWEAFWV
jgi:hypothetical protein